MKNKNCPYCHSELSEIQRNFSAHLHIGYQGYCNICEIPFKRLTNVNLEDTGWYSTKIKEAELLEILSDAQRLKISQLLSGYKTASKKWEIFQKRKRKNDCFYLFSTDENRKGVCIVRDGFPVLDFQIKEYYFSKID